LRLATTEVKAEIDFITKKRKKIVFCYFVGVLCIFCSRKSLFLVAKKQTENLKITLESKNALGMQQNLNTSACDVPPREPQTQNEKTSSISTLRLSESVEGLS